MVLLHNPVTEVFILQHDNLVTKQEEFIRDLPFGRVRGLGLPVLEELPVRSATESSSSGSVMNTFWMLHRRGTSGPSTMIPSIVWMQKSFGRRRVTSEFLEPALWLGQWESASGQPLRWPSWWNR
jgi:hypothetical protein